MKGEIFCSAKVLLASLTHFQDTLAGHQVHLILLWSELQPSEKLSSISCVTRIVASDTKPPVEELIKEL